MKFDYEISRDDGIWHFFIWLENAQVAMVTLTHSELK